MQVQIVVYFYFELQLHVHVNQWPIEAKYHIVMPAF